MKLTEEQKLANKMLRARNKRIAAEQARYNAEVNQKPVSSMRINIEWKNSRTWGANPHLDAYVSFKDGTSESFTATCSGCGYDKTSTVVGELFDAFLKYKLHARLPFINPPYGVSAYKSNEVMDMRLDSCYYGKGIGIECYGKIGEFIGGKFERVASGKMFDAFTYTDLETANV